MRSQTSRSVQFFRLTFSLLLFCGVSAHSMAQTPSSTNEPATESQNKATETNAELEPAPPSTVLIKTTYGDITLDLALDQAPVTVENFLTYVRNDFYDGTIFHRVIPNFMVQGGGFTESMMKKPVRRPIVNEADNGLKNNRGTIAMARTSRKNSATSQFFINVVDNSSLDHNPQSFGYAVFGEVTSGMDVVDKIVSVPTGSRGVYNDVPKKPVVIQDIEILSSAMSEPENAEPQMSDETP